MSVEEGIGSDEGVEYFFTLTRHTAWSCTYECRFHRRFLDEKSISQMKSSSIRVGQKDWHLHVVKSSIGDIGAFLTSESHEPAIIDYDICLLNTEASAAVKTWSQPISPEMTGVLLGLRKFSTVEAIKNPDSGFLFGEVFKFRAYIREKDSENERFNFQQIGRSASVIWSLRNLASESSLVGINSPPFHVNESKWCTVHSTNGLLGIEGAIAGGEHEGQGRCPSIYIVPCHDTSYAVTSIVTLLNRKRCGHGITKEFVYDYKIKHGYGWKCFCEAVFLENPDLNFLEDGWITFHVHINVPGDDGLSTSKDKHSVHSRPGGNKPSSHWFRRLRNILKC